eukprot:2651965-Rhodomonas_salina.3
MTPHDSSLTVTSLFIVVLTRTYYYCDYVTGLATNLKSAMPLLGYVSNDFFDDEPARQTLTVAEPTQLKGICSAAGERAAEDPDSNADVRLHPSG